MQRRIIRKAVNRVELDQLRDLNNPSIVTNRFGQGGFNPISSGHRAASVVREPWTNQWLRSLQPEVISNEQNVTVQALDWSFNTPPRPDQFVRVANMALPAPMPVSVTLGAWKPTADKLRLNERFSAVVAQQGHGANNGQNPGVFLIEWGQGKARSYIVTDLAPGSIQIPVAQFVIVWAFLGHDGTAQPEFNVGEIGARAAAQLYPGATNPGARATYTATVSSFNNAGPINTGIGANLRRLPPYARYISGQISGNFGTAFSANVQLIERIITAAAWTLVAPDQAAVPVLTNGTRPHAIRDQPLSGGLSDYVVELPGPPLVGGAQAAAVFSIQT